MSDLEKNFLLIKDKILQPDLLRNILETHLTSVLKNPTWLPPMHDGTNMSDAKLLAEARESFTKETPENLSYSFLVKIIWS